jgi:hypothetical protein
MSLSLVSSCVVVSHEITTAVLDEMNLKQSVITLLPKCYEPLFRFPSTCAIF